MTQTIKEILNLTFSISEYTKQAPAFDNVRRGPGFKKLEALEKKYSGIPPGPATSLVTIIFRSFIDSVKRGRGGKDIIKRRRDARALAWALGYKDDDPIYAVNIPREESYLRPALDILEAHYRHSMLPPLLLAYLNSWPYPKEIFARFLRETVERTDMSPHSLASAIASSKQWILYIDGAVKLGNYTAVSDIPPARVCEHLSLPDYYIGTRYFSDYVISHIETALRKAITVDKIKEQLSILQKRDDSVTTKRALVRIIFRLGSDASTEYINLLRPVIFKELGDPDLRVWGISSHNENAKESEYFEKARRIFRQWLIRESIELFFDMLSARIDPHGFKYRKAFWLAYVQHIDSFRLIVSDTIKRNLKINVEQWETIQGRISVFDGAVDPEECAFLFTIKGRTFMEFGRINNALYVYKTDSPYTPELNRAKYRISDLKYSGYKDFTLIEKDEGKFIHTGSERYYWQNRLRDWLLRRLNASTSHSYRT